jgi:hypothetical protein
MSPHHLLVWFCVLRFLSGFKRILQENGLNSNACNQLPFKHSLQASSYPISVETSHNSDSPSYSSASSRQHCFEAVVIEPNMASFKNTLPYSDPLDNSAKTMSSVLVTLSMSPATSISFPSTRTSSQSSDKTLAQKPRAQNCKRDEEIDIELMPIEDVPPPPFPSRPSQTDGTATPHATEVSQMPEEAHSKRRKRWYQRPDLAGLAR